MCHILPLCNGITVAQWHLGVTQLCHSDTNETLLEILVLTNIITYIFHLFVKYK